VLRDRADSLNAGLSSQRKAEERYRSQVVRELAGGTLPIDGVPSSRQLAGWKHGSDASEVVVAAIAAVHASVDTAMWTAAPEIFAALQTLVADVVAESVQLTASIPAEVEDEKAAFTASRGGAHHFKSWMRLTELVDVWVRCHRLARVLREAGWIAGPAHHHKSEHRPEAWAMFQRPDLLPPGWRDQPEQLKIGCSTPAGPGLYDWDDAKARLASHDARYGRRDVHAMTQVTVFKNAQDAALNFPVLEASAQAAVPTRPAGW
jgi:hypothetical protein